MLIQNITPPTLTGLFNIKLDWCSRVQTPQPTCVSWCVIPVCMHCISHTNEAAAGMSPCSKYLVTFHEWQLHFCALDV